MEKLEYVLEYDEELDAIASLELLSETLPKAIIYPHYWKWVVIALHSALQGFMVLALHGTNFLRVLTEESAADWIEAFDGDESPKKPPRLDNFMNLYSKIKSDTMKYWSNSKIFVPQENQDESVEKLNNHRNGFIHYVPMSSLFDTRVWAKIVIDIIPIIEFLVFESNNITLHDTSSEKKVRGLCKLISNQATTILDAYNT